jgi:fatty-acyl-CoA synthase
VTHYSPSGVRSATVAEIGDAADPPRDRSMRRLGVREGDRVGTLHVNNPEHLALYLFAVPCMGAVLHTFNIRLDERQTAYVIDHGALVAVFRRRVHWPRKLAPVCGGVRTSSTWCDRRR